MESQEAQSLPSQGSLQLAGSDNSWERFWAGEKISRSPEGGECLFSGRNSVKTNSLEGLTGAAPPFHLPGPAASLVEPFCTLPLKERACPSPTGNAQLKENLPVIHCGRKRGDSSQREEPQASDPGLLHLHSLVQGKSKLAKMVWSGSLTPRPLALAPRFVNNGCVTAGGTDTTACVRHEVLAWPRPTAVL